MPPAAPNPRRPPRRPPRSRLAQLLLVLFQTLAVLVSFDVAALAGALADDCCTDSYTDSYTDSHTDAGASGESSCQECPAEREGRECPPACPDCHRAHGVLGLPGMAAGLRPLPAASTQEPVSLRPHEARVPRAPSIFGVYRPPRSLPVSV